MDDIRNKTYYPLRYQLQFFGAAAEKTEEPTAKKLSDARKEGQVARSKELITATGLTALFLILKIFLGYIGNSLIQSFQKTYQNIDKFSSDFTLPTSHALFRDALATVLRICLPVYIAAMVVSFVVILFQVKWKLSGKPMKPKFSKINPVTGFKKIFSKDKVVELIIEVLKIVIISYITYDTLKGEWATLLKLYDIYLFQAILLIGKIVIDLGLKISIIFLLIGFGDLFYQN